ncbi:GNAT family N-acetyltransferase [Chitinivorax sp. B]|uniref:GNAT family N-acetyltransferase n=1 Tax=Chitinivorax sp. B TaxID=2502235 RepID=UPI0010F5806F|nr:GNAT family N-acetyltransferase [Chitinivorax sp. B]
MSDTIQIVIDNNPSGQMTRVLYKGIFEANVARTGDGTVDVISVFARDGDDKVIGGIIGSAYWGWINITSVWVDPAHRRQGLASRMLRTIEAEAVERGYHHAYLDTFTFQTPDLYLRAGYEIIGTLDQFPPGFARHFMRKTLIRS